jgi:hypothetical protein
MFLTERFFRKNKIQEKNLKNQKVKRWKIFGRKKTHSRKNFKNARTVLSVREKSRVLPLSVM